MEQTKQYQANKEELLKWLEQFGMFGYQMPVHKAPLYIAMPDGKTVHKVTKVYRKDQYIIELNHVLELA